MIQKTVYFELFVHKNLEVKTQPRISLPNSDISSSINLQTVEEQTKHVGCYFFDKIFKICPGIQLKCFPLQKDKECLLPYRIRQWSST